MLDVINIWVKGIEPGTLISNKESAEPKELSEICNCGHNAENHYNVGSAYKNHGPCKICNCLFFGKSKI